MELGMLGQNVEVLTIDKQYWIGVLTEETRDYIILTRGVARIYIISNNIIAVRPL